MQDPEGILVGQVPLDVGDEVQVTAGRHGDEEVAGFDVDAVGHARLRQGGPDPATTWGSDGRESVDCGCFQHHDELGRG